MSVLDPRFAVMVSRDTLRTILRVFEHLAARPERIQHRRDIERALHDHGVLSEYHAILRALDITN